VWTRENRPEGRTKCAFSRLNLRFSAVTNVRNLPLNRNHGPIRAIGAHDLRHTAGPRIARAGVACPRVLPGTSSLALVRGYRVPQVFAKPGNFSRKNKQTFYKGFSGFRYNAVRNLMLPLALGISASLSALFKECSCGFFWSFYRGWPQGYVSIRHVVWVCRQAANHSNGRLACL
jgi:hypothetical protein